MAQPMFTGSLGIHGISPDVRATPYAVAHRHTLAVLFQAILIRIYIVLRRRVNGP
jgi:hypothetical protein